jgi:hypothetical protein
VTPHNLASPAGLLNQNATNFDTSEASEFDAFAPVMSRVAAVKTAVQQQALYLTEPGETTAIDVYDINQGQLGDCFLLSSIGEIALLKPSFISNMIHANSNGTETVTLYKAANGTLPTFGTTSFKATTETVTNVFPSDSVNNGASQDVVGGVKEIWPQVLENAVAQLDGGYGGIANGGNPVIAMEELTGHAATYIAPTSLTLAALLGFSNAGDLIVMDTSSQPGLLDNLVSNHAYMFDGVTGSGTSAAVKLLNPWGNDEPPPVLLSQLSKGIVEIDIGHLA